MRKTLQILVTLMWLKIKITLNLAVENIALRQQLAVMKRTNKRPKIRMTDRLFWVLLSRLWTGWRKSVVIVKPDTVVRWHHNGFKLFWKFKSKSPGRPRVSRQIRDLETSLTIDAYRRDLALVARVAEREAPGLPCRQVTCSLLDRVLTSAEVLHIEDGLRSPASLHRIKAAVRVFFSWTARVGITEDNPARAALTLELACLFSV
jgi:hypothetical protein